MHVCSDEQSYGSGSYLRKSSGSISDISGGLYPDTVNCVGRFRIRPELRVLYVWSDPDDSGGRTRIRLVQEVVSGSG